MGRASVAVYVWHSGESTYPSGRAMTGRSSVRQARVGDIDRVAELWAEHVDYHADLDPRFKRREGSTSGFRDHLRRNLGRPEFLLLVAEAEDQVVGFLHGELLQHPPCFERRAHGFISDLAVSSRWQRAGVGTALLEEGMAWLSEKGVATVEGKVLMSNPKAMGFWDKAGFEPYMLTFRTSVEGWE